jgi:hypothetical protein
MDGSEFEIRNENLLFDMFEREKILPDTDGDGYPDDLRLAIAAGARLSDPYVWAGVLNLVARLAFETIALNLPVVRASLPDPALPGLFIHPPSTRNRRTGLYRDASGFFHVRGGSGKEIENLLNTIAFSRAPGPASTSRRETPLRPPVRKRRGAIDLLNLSGPGGIFHTPEDRPRERILSAGIRLEGDRISPLLGRSLADMVARMVLEATEISLPLAFAGADPPHPVVFSVCEEKGGRGRIRCIGTTPGAPPAIGVISGKVSDLGRWFEAAVSETGPGSEAVDSFRDGIKAFGSMMETPRAPLPACASPRPNRPKPLFRKAEWKGEVERLLDLAHRTPPGIGTLFGEIQVSKPAEIRNGLEKRLTALFDSLGYRPELTVLNAYKPGYSWLVESLLPRLKRLPQISRLEFAYRPFPRAGGALEMSSRWLQELFPGPEIVARELGVPGEAIRFFASREIPRIYRVSAFGRNGVLLLEEGFSPRWSRFPYLQSRPEGGYVHPTAAGMRLWQAEGTILDASIPTDRERFWRILQDRWLPELETRMKENIPSARSPFWEEIRIEAFIDETDSPVSFMDERISPMEALHEDVYFVLLDAFADFLRRFDLSPSLHIGRILPFTFSRRRGAFPSATLRAKPPRRGTLPPAAPPSDASGIPPAAVSIERKIWKIDFGKTSAEMGAVPEAFYASAPARRFRMRRENNLLCSKPPRLIPADTGGSPPPDSEETPPEGRIVRYAEVLGWISRLARFPDLRVWVCGRSFQGRPIHALEASSKTGGSLASLARRRFLKPTILFNARHHANEISSTTASLSTALRLLSTESGRRRLRGLNIVWIPVENPDGVAALESLLVQGEGRKLHAARYNALGVEFYADYFSRSPGSPEAEAKPRLFRRWLPEIMVDHHGVPSHEWEQPFSGYVPGRFRKYWLPWTFVYAHLPFVDEPAHPHHPFALRLKEVLEEAIAEDPQICEANRRIASVYRRYAFDPEPHTFPAPVDEACLTLPLSDRTRDSNFAVRHPEVTRTEIVVEVPDEVASGNQLRLCVEAHRRIEEKLILRLRSPEAFVKNRPDPRTGGIRLSWSLSGPAEI